MIASGRGNPVPRDVFTDPCWLSVTKWVDDCCATHVSYLANEDSILPMRYLHILNSGDNMSPSVQICENDTGRTGRFAALSHVREASKPINTTRANIAGMLQVIPYQRLPRTFQHAVSICAKLGLRFLWIDSLCIIQDDDRDWRIHASKMADVYANSYVTIAAHPTGNMRGDFLRRGIHAEVRQIECQPYGDDEFGEVTSGSLTLYAYRIPVKYGGEANHLGWMIALSGGIEGTCTLDTVEDKKLAEEREIYCIELERSEVDDVNSVSAEAIVVVPSDRAQGAYQRIGFVSYCRQAKDLPYSEYTII